VPPIKEKGDIIQRASRSLMYSININDSMGKLKYIDCKHFCSDFFLHFSTKGDSKLGIKNGYAQRAHQK